MTADFDLVAFEVLIPQEHDPLFQRADALLRRNLAVDSHLLLDLSSHIGEVGIGLVPGRQLCRAQ